MHSKILLSLTLAAVLHASARSHAAGQNPQFETRRIDFRQLLNTSAEVRLAGNASTRSVAFPCAPDSVPADGSELHLFLGHSPGLDSSRSFFSVALNYGVLRSVRLDDTNQGGTEVVIPLPPASLKPSNELILSVNQSGLAGAPAASVWTSIGSQSYISLRFQPRAAAPDLASLPLSLLGRGRTIDVLVPRQASTASLEAAALLVATFAARTAPEPLRVRPVGSMRAAANPVLAIGTPDEQPEIRGVAGTVEEGVAGLAAGPEQPVLFVTGANPEAVLRAAKGLIGPAAPLTGKLARFASPAERPGMETREWKGYIPASDRFTLASLEIDETKLTAAGNYSATIPLNSTPDAVFLDRGHEMTLFFRFEAPVFDVNPELVIEWNGAPLKRGKLRELSKRPQFSVTIDIPARMLRKSNTLVVSVRGGLDAIETAGALLPASELYLPRDYRAVLPDLALLRQRFYPFTIRPDLSDTLLLIPDRPDSGMFGALLQLAAGIGGMMPADCAAFRVRRYKEATEKELSASHAIFLGAGVTPGQLVKNWPADLDPRGGPALQEVFSPWNSKKCVLSITAGSGEMLEIAVGRLFASLPELAGDAAYLGHGGPRCAVLARTRAIVESSFLTHVQAGLSANWMALPLVLSLVSGILLLGTRLAIARYRTGRHG